ncbi:DUF2716 domain-containing protein [Micromonospora sp. CA-249363]|uniref:DUF2716 domain-containing protein n=1 Tax=Micromonospora sp. CA-249363 TaxID=3239963 RepID=UPI003D8F472F
MLTYREPRPTSILAFLTPDLNCGTFGHPWEKSLCVFGERLVEPLAHTLDAWLPRKRVNGRAVN